MATVKSNVTVKIDANVKERALQIFALMGLDQATAIELFFRQVITERRLPFQPAAPLLLDEKIAQAIKEKNIPEVVLECDENGNAVIDKEKHPELYDWAVNG